MISTEELRKSQNLEKFLSTLQLRNSKYYILDAIAPQLQQGYNCGYYAASIVTVYWNAISKNYPLYAARKRDITFPDTQFASLRCIGKRNNLCRVGAIWNVADFDTIFQHSAYTTSIAEFTTLKHFSYLLQQLLKKGFPVILPIDLGFLPSEQVSAFQRAHYITILGYYLENEQVMYVYTSHGRYDVASEGVLFGACNTLENYGQSTFIKTQEGWLKNYTPVKTDIIKDRYDLPITKLNGLKNKIVLIFPRSQMRYQEDISVVIQESNSLFTDTVKREGDYGYPNILRKRPAFALRRKSGEASQARHLFEGKYRKVDETNPQSDGVRP